MKHGIIRIVHADGRIYERSYKNDVEHGLELKYKKRSVTVSLNVAEKIKLEQDGVEFEDKAKDRLNFNPHLNPSDYNHRHGWHQQGEGDLYDLSLIEAFEPENWKPPAKNKGKSYFEDESVSDNNVV